MGGVSFDVGGDTAATSALDVEGGAGATAFGVGAVGVGSLDTGEGVRVDSLDIAEAVPVDSLDSAAPEPLDALDVDVVADAVSVFGVVN